jgi:ABC-2 type transport system permease protein/lipopolysaccharide transport system permease protein
MVFGMGNGYGPRPSALAGSAQRARCCSDRPWNVRRSDASREIGRSERMSEHHKSSDAALAADDLRHGLKLWRMWIKLGWNDILLQYRRSLLGPFWLSAGTVISVITIGVIYARLFRIGLPEFVPFLCAGLLVWGYISTILNEAGGLFTASESYIKQIRLPYSIYVYKFIWSKIIVFAHNLFVYLGVIIYFQFWPGAAVLVAIPGFLLLTLNGALSSLYLGMVSARFRDIPQIVISMVQIAFFVTPIMWKTELLDPKSLLVLLNPFFYLVDILRAPLLGQIPDTTSYAAVLLITSINAAIAATFFTRFRRRIAYWV